MARKSNIARNDKRLALSNRLSEKRDALRKRAKDASLSLQDRMEASHQLQKMPRDSSPCRIRNRCALSGRPHGYYRRFGLAKSMLRQKAMGGEIPGLVKASW